MMLNGDSGSRGEEYVPPTAPVEVGVVSLVVERPRRGRTGRGDDASGEEDRDDHDGSTGQSGVKNFQKGNMSICTLLAGGAYFGKRVFLTRSVLSQLGST